MFEGRLAYMKKLLGTLVMAAGRWRYEWVLLLPALLLDTVAASLSLRLATLEKLGLTQ